MTRQPTFAASVRLMLRIKWVRFRNRIENPRSGGVLRSGTGRKGQGSFGLTVGFTAIFAAMAFFWSAVGVSAAAEKFSPSDLAHLLAAVPALAFVILFLLTFGSEHGNDGGLEKDVEWMLTLPAETSAIYAALALEKSLLSPAWLFVWPYFTCALWEMGYGPVSIPLALALMLPFALLLAGAVILAEVLVRRLLGIYALRSMKVFALIVGGISAAVLGYAQEWLHSIAVAYADVVWPIVQGAAWLPTGVGLKALAGGEGSSLAAAVGLCQGFLLAVGGVSVFVWATRRGMEAVQSGYRGSREASAQNVGRRLSILRKDVRMLWRDKRLLVEVGFSFFQLLPWLNATVSGGRSAAQWGSLALGVGIWPLFRTAPNVLFHERDGLWLLFTIPKSIQRIIGEKVVVWVVLAWACSGLVLLGVIAFRGVVADDLTTAVFILVGLPAFGTVAASIGIYGTDPYASEHQRVRATAQVLIGYLGFLLVALLFLEGAWPKISGLLIFCLMAFAWWQKACVYAEYILDPTEKPPGDVYVADALVAVVIFFVTQSILSSIGVALDLSLEVTTTLAYALTSIVTLVAVNDAYSASNVDVWGRLSVLGEGKIWEASRASFIPALVSVGTGALYLLVLPQIEWMFGSTGDRPGLWIVFLAVFCAPLIEEVLFRGLLFSGLAASMNPRAASLISALAFTLVHPAVSAVPVFVLGLTTAWAYRKSGQLLSPMLVHAAYNLVIVMNQ